MGKLGKTVLLIDDEYGAPERGKELIDDRYKNIRGYAFKFEDARDPSQQRTFEFSKEQAVRRILQERPYAVLLDMKFGNQDVFGLDIVDLLMSLESIFPDFPKQNVAICSFDAYRQYADMHDRAHRSYDSWKYMKSTAFDSKYYFELNHDDMVAEYVRKFISKWPEEKKMQDFLDSCRVKAPKSKNFDERWNKSKLCL